MIAFVPLSDTERPIFRVLAHGLIMFFLKDNNSLVLVSYLQCLERRETDGPWPQSELVNISSIPFSFHLQ